ncbi:type II/IV secretion system protein [Candidatus Saccharibacteria bacterium]|nr:type II/IV secretion system protein [Candidatus Saccharibacteria bacterium]
MSVLSAVSQKNVEERLVADKLIDATRMEELKKKAEQTTTPLFSLLVAEGGIDAEDLTRITAKVTKIPYVNLMIAKIDEAILELLPQDIAERYMAIPLGEMQNRLAVAMLDADNVQAVDFLSNKIGRPLKVYTASEQGIRSALGQYKAQVDAALTAQPAEDTDQAPGTAGQKNAIRTIVQDSPISKALNTILEYAAKNRASDIHIEALEHELKIRARIDGVLREIMKLPKSTEAPLISRIKILSNLKIDEHRIPQDGQFTIKVADKEIDLRIAVSPVVWGEQVVIRLLDKSGTSLNLEDMGYRGRALRTIRKGIASPNGLVLTSGPTGSGKSTSLYALIQEIMDDAINIVTLEDPVEYKMNGINQIQVHADVGLTFAAGLRSILRQDPDVVMVGEIRDAETATLAVQAALTGHLVFSTLHTNSAAGILPRLLDMGIEPFLIASTVRTVIGQRLVRKLANPTPYQSDATETAMVKKYIGGLLPEKESDVAGYAKDLGYESLPLMHQKAYTLYKGEDTPATPGGYKGRLGLYEVFEITETIQDLIMQRASSSEIQKTAQAEGMVTMQQDGFLKALEGKTTLAEIARVASEGSA